MPRYDLVANAIDSLSNRIHGASQDKLAHQERMGQTGVQNARLGLEGQQIRGEREVKMAQIERDKYLDEVTSIGEAVSSSKIPDAQKKIFLSQMSPEMASLPTTRRKAAETFFEAFKARQKASAEATKQASEIEQKQLDRSSRERMAAEGRKATIEAAKIRNQGKPEDQLKGLKLRAWNDYLEGKASPRQQKLIGVDKDPNLGRAIELIKNDDTMFGQPTEVIAERAKAIAGQLGGSKSAEQPKELTRDIAIEYLRKANGDKEAAKKLAADDGYQF